MLAACALLVSACKQHAAPPPNTYNNDTVAFFPVQDYLRAQIKSIDSVPYFMYRLTVTDDKKDSATITREQFNEATQVFTRFNIAEPAIKKYYSESVFGDQSTNSYTISYTTNNKDLPVQRIDVLLKPEDQKVKRIFITTMENRNDSSIVTRLGWKQNESCTINTSISHKGKNSNTQTTLVWNGQN
ncbi:hypothetical protein DXN05_18620 [Deminuibacter soli]|uniref:Uncharacterized protein n=1 Tax=Deminuibacter soli TaxID=2291815 RepID=A0A3E1NFK9_9BACT|nr:hypothetical protein DXN05_18620 [Deminuibacter soli]